MSATNHFAIWTEYQMKYTCLKQRFIELTKPYISSTCLMQLKSRYNGIIHSRREADNINNLSDLLRILENRAILDYKSVEPLKYIVSQFVADQELDKMIYKYEMNVKCQQTLPLFNVYQCQHTTTSTGLASTRPIRIPVNEDPNSSIHSHIGTHRMLPEMLRSHGTFASSLHIKQQKSVFKKLSSDLDRYWRDLARFLDITESEIEEIDHNTALQLHDKAFKALEIYGERSDPSTWHITLIQALNDVRRRDLTDVVARILDNSS